MEVRELAADQDHEVLGVDYCSGYPDHLGKWNTGFYCPSLGNGETVYCCGTATYKYCCTRRDQQPTVGISQTVVLGSALGSVLMLILVALVSCVACRRCLPYRRSHPSLGGGPLYSMHCSSTASGVANMYSFSGMNTAATTPMDSHDPHHTLIDLDCRHEGNNLEQGRDQMRVSVTRGGGYRGNHLPSDPPPPYNSSPTHHSLIPCDPERIGRDLRISGISSTTSFTQCNLHHCQNTVPSQRSPGQPANSLITPGDNLYWSTKF